ncbi:periphilin-1 isoform X31 [Canis lupus familiaris]|uniref:periphilin-1 isoform X30 n=2 Tax=Canis lupus familiaris TaxID=9615 RepID=UPI0018F7B2AF|nr:periphilin-1 isoform X30 [Canis lupus familiaris]XP_022267279.2 periphilin-1 isoform X30 [Canis lupus familiaris]XP_022267280.2 periphilin-1 isoform X31 [Canis lupus familiaris]XP_038315913.1 periphilin-1 isoform X30 [Canis lupus familiaris]XP_038315914.1 periphilin-1 isoform X30 [Canis lupus familiaris]XP_038315915.1 periphilin-1 isoform X31 [Canis lupus familiaris]
MAYRRDEMWSEGRYDYERLPRERIPPRSHPSDGYHRVVNIVPKKPPLLDRPGEGNYNRYYSHVDYREYDEGRSFSHDRRSGPPHRGDESGYRWTRDDHSASRQPEYRDMRDGFRRKSFYSSHYARDRSPHKRDTPFFRESPVGRKDSPHSRSGSSVSSRSYSPERSKTYSFHQSQHRKSIRAGTSYKRQNEGNPERGKERPVQSLKTSRDTSPSSSSAVPSSKMLDKPSRLTEKELAEAASKWAAEKLEKADESNLPDIEYEAGSTAPLFIDQPEEPESNVTDGIELFEDSQLTSRSKAIASKTKEIEQVYRQDCETFGMVVKMLIEKDPSLEKSIQFALRQNLHEIEFPAREPKLKEGCNSSFATTLETVILLSLKCSYRQYAVSRAASHQVGRHPSFVINPLRKTHWPDVCNTFKQAQHQPTGFLSGTGSQVLFSAHIVFAWWGRQEGF